jgi:hypothetical protein
MSSHGRAAESAASRHGRAALRRFDEPVCLSRLSHALDQCDRRRCRLGGSHQGQNVGGPRYDANQTSEQRHGFENLILLCAVHHIEIDADSNLDTYTVDRLCRSSKRMKRKPPHRINR